MTGASQLTVLSEYRWPSEPARELPVLPGYVLSSFSPLVAAAAEGCLSAYYADPQAAAASRERTAVLLVTAGNDVVSAEHVRDRVASGRRLGPLFFFQIAPNSVIGQLTARWGLGGPVVSISPQGDPLADGLAEAELLLDDGDAEEVLLILAEQADPAELADPAVPGSGDRAQALLVRGGRS
jgi:hypothetical protein